MCYRGEKDGHFQIDQTPTEEEIVLFDPTAMECLDTKVFSDQIARSNDIYNQSVSTEEDPRLGVD